nr:MAG TPA: protein of unknown function DUF4969 [Caudoviricetes sp.]
MCNRWWIAMLLCLTLSWMSGCAGGKITRADVCAAVRFDLRDPALLQLCTQNKRALKSYTQICQRGD